jgi:hypothetical protein
VQGVRQDDSGLVGQQMGGTPLQGSKESTKAIAGRSGGYKGGKAKAKKLSLHDVMRRKRLRRQGGLSFSSELPLSVKTER